MKQTEKLAESIKANLDKKKKIFFFFDYDGVLAPIQNNPSTAYLRAKTKRMLLRIAAKNFFKIAIVSGRHLSTLKKLTKIKTNKIILIGSHGLELFLQCKKRFLLSKNIGILKSIKARVINLAKSKANGFVETKPYTLTYHIRDKKNKELVKTLSMAINKLLNKLKLSQKIQILEGKNIVEIMPREITKGKAVEKVIKLYPGYLPIYFGDDVTDISALKIVKKYKGISISLNPHLRFKADFLINQKDIKDLLSGLLQV